MDIWKWVIDTTRELRESGHHRLAQLIDEIPNNVCSGNQALAQAALPEALAAARSIQNPWLEVYFRHWVANGKVSRCEEGEAALKETVALFEFAHRPETIQCPQTICTTQDIAICYGRVDGPGYAAERLAVCEETIARIDPSWACFSCISGELIDALVDAGRVAEAVTVAKRQIERITLEGEGAGLEITMTLARAQFVAGELEEALDLLQFMDEKAFPEDSPADRFKRSCLRFRIVAAQGKLQEAWDKLPSESDDAQHRGNADLIAGLAQVLPGLPLHNSYHIGRRTLRALRRYSDGGAHRTTLEVAGHHVRLAVARGARWSARQGLDLARPHLAKLRSPLGAPEQFAALEAMVAAMPPPGPLHVPADALAEAIRSDDGSDAERDLEQLLLAAAQRPADPGIAIMLADAMGACGAAEHARAHLWSFLRSNPDSFEGGEHLLQVLLAERDQAGVAQLAAVVQDAAPLLSAWCLLRLAVMSERWQDVAVQAERLLALAPDFVGAKRYWAAACMRLKQFDQALDLRQEMADVALAAADPDAKGWLWDALVAASAAEQWDRVRTLAAQLGMELSGDAGPVSERWELIRLQFVAEGDTYERHAVRTGPATAKVITLTGQWGPQHIHDVLVFDPAPLEDWPEDPEERREFVQLYDSIHLLAAGNFSQGFLIDGVAPSDAQLACMTAEFDALGWEWDRRSEPDYQVFDNTTEESRAGLYFLLAAPSPVAPATVHARLTELTAGFAHPMCWPALAEAAGLDVDKHQAIEQRYDL